VFKVGTALPQFLETDILGVLLEALSAHVEAVFPDDTVLVSAYSALPGAGSVFAGVRVPDVVVTHDYCC